MIHEKYKVRVGLLYDFKQGKTTAESYRLNEVVISLRQCQN